ncbi:unnamed protein product [Amoebophrya sp. A120]|nr:unnamed protein product [Amoebophrya sp. A120]|eukprot:GSA120T00019989001.1
MRVQASSKIMRILRARLVASVILFSIEAGPALRFVSSLAVHSTTSLDSTAKQPFVIFPWRDSVQPLPESLKSDGGAATTTSDNEAAIDAAAIAKSPTAQTRKRQEVTASQIGNQDQHDASAPAEAQPEGVVAGIAHHQPFAVKNSLTTGQEEEVDASEEVTGPERERIGVPVNDADSATTAALRNVFVQKQDADEDDSAPPRVQPQPLPTPTARTSKHSAPGSSSLSSTWLGALLERLPEPRPLNLLRTTLFSEDGEMKNQQIDETISAANLGVSRGGPSVVSTTSSPASSTTPSQKENDQKINKKVNQGEPASVLKQSSTQTGNPSQEVNKAVARSIKANTRLSSAERFGRILAFFAMIFHGTSYLYIKGLKAEEYRQMGLNTHPFLYYEPYLIQIYFYLGSLLASTVSFLYLENVASGGGGGGHGSGLSPSMNPGTTTAPGGGGAATTLPPSSWQHLVGNRTAVLGERSSSLYGNIFKNAESSTSSSSSSHNSAGSPTTGTFMNSTQPFVYGDTGTAEGMASYLMNGGGAGAVPGAPSSHLFHRLALGEQETQLVSFVQERERGRREMLAHTAVYAKGDIFPDAFLHPSGMLSGAMAALCISCAFITVEHIGVPLSTSLVSLTAVLGSFFLGFNVFENEVWSANMALIGLTLILLGLFGVCMARELGRYVACSEERSPLLQVFELDAIWEVNNRLEKKVTGIVLAVLGGLAGAFMFVPFQSTAFAPTVQLVQESTWSMSSLQDGSFESAAEQGQPLTVGKIATLTHLFTFLPSFAFGASCTGCGISVLYYLTHWEALRIAWKKHPDFFEVFCAVIAGLVWLISVFFTLIAMSYVGFTIACTFFHSWMLIYSAWNILLFNEIRGKGYSVYSFAQLLSLVGFMALCLSMNK